MTQTLIGFRGANCSWCLNNMLEHLRAHESVVSVRWRSGTGCIEVDHDAADLADLLSGVKADLHGWRPADNGERVMIDLDIHPFKLASTGRRVTVDSGRACVTVEAGSRGRRWSTTAWPRACRGSSACPPSPAWSGRSRSKT